MIVNIMEVCIPASEYSQFIVCSTFVLAYHEDLEKPRVAEFFRKSNINASVQTPNGHEEIAASSAPVLYLFGEVGPIGKRNDVSCKLSSNAVVKLDCDNMSKAYRLHRSLL
jgi:hypothetical protein